MTLYLLVMGMLNIVVFGPLIYGPLDEPGIGLVTIASGVVAIVAVVYGELTR